MRLPKLLYASMTFLLIISFAFWNIVPILAQEGGTESDVDYQLFESSGTLSTNYYPFAGGGSCCDCGTRHFGILPDNFEEQDIKSVTFFLLTSRSNSHYQHITVGSNKLELTLTNNDASQKESYSAIASSMELDDDHEFPISIDVSWYITFEFEGGITNVGPGWEWTLDDGDSNLLSAVWLHMSDIDSVGLPGTAQTYGCQYDEKRPAHYSVMFSGQKSQEVSPPSPSTDDITVSRSVTRAANSNQYSITLDIKNESDIKVTNLVVYETLHDLQFIGDPANEHFSVDEYSTDGSDYRIVMKFDVGALNPGMGILYQYKVVPIVDGEIEWSKTPPFEYMGYSDRATGKSWFGKTGISYDQLPANVKPTVYIDNELDRVSGTPIGKIDTSTDMLIVSSAGALISKYDAADAYRILGEMADVAANQKGILGLLELGVNDDWFNVDQSIEQWIAHELQWNTSDDSEYYLMIIGDNEVIPFALLDDPIIDSGVEGQRTNQQKERIPEDWCPSDTYYADIDEDWRQDLCFGRIIAWEIDDLIRLMSTTLTNAGTKVTIIADSNLHSTYDETSDPSKIEDLEDDWTLWDFKVWFDLIEGYFGTGTTAVLTTQHDEHIDTTTIGFQDLLDDAILVYGGHGGHDKFNLYDPGNDDTNADHQLSSLEIPDNVNAGAVFIVCACGTSRAIDGEMVTTNDYIGKLPKCPICGSEWCFLDNMGLKLIDSGAYSYIGATMPARIWSDGTGYAGQVTSDLVKEWVDEQQTIGMALKESMQNLKDTSTFDDSFKRTFLSFTLYGNPKFTLNPLPGAGTSGAVSLTESGLAMSLGNPRMEIDLDFEYTLVKKGDEWIFYTTSPGTTSALWKAPYSPVIPMNLFKVDLPPESAIQDIMCTATKQELGTHELWTLSEPLEVSNGAYDSSGETAELPDDVYDYQPVRNLDGSLTLHFRVYPIQYEESTKLVALYNNINIAVDYTPARSAELSLILPEEPIVTKGESVGLLWQVENKIGKTQDVTARFTITNTIGNVVAEVEDTRSIDGNAESLFEANWTANVAPNCYLIRVDLIDGNAITVDNKTMSLKVLETGANGSAGDGINIGIVIGIIAAMVVAVAGFFLVRARRKAAR